MLYRVVVLIFVSLSFLHAQTRITFVEDPFPPYVLGETGKKPTGGIAYKIINKIMEKIPEAEPDFVELLPWKRALALVKAGNIDAIMHLYKTEERQKDYFFTDSTYPGRTVLFYNPKKFPDGLHWEKLNDLTRYQLCHIEGAAVREYLINQGKKLGISFNMYATTDALCFNLLDRGRIDAFVYLESTGYEYLNRNNLVNKYSVAEKPVYSKDVYMAFSKKTEAHKLIPKINEIIAQLKEDGTIDKIVRGQD